MPYTNDTKPNTTSTNDTDNGGDLTWGETEETWGSTDWTWGNQINNLTSDSKPSGSYSNDTKPS